MKGFKPSKEIQDLFDCLLYNIKVENNELVVKHGKDTICKL